MKKHDELIKKLESHKVRAPSGFSDGVLDDLPAWRRRNLLTRHRGWLVPALVGAAAMLVVMLGVDHLGPAPSDTATSQHVMFHFELHAPGADQVELLGTFNDWKMGDIVLSGPDNSGQWTATVELPEGRHEYIFLVDGERWIADPKAATVRSDGFGNLNAVIQVYDENSV